MQKQHPTDGSKVTSAWRSPSRPDHAGTDFRAPTGTPIKAAHAGVVRQYASTTGGNVVEITADGGQVKSYYSHLSKYRGKDGRTVKAGDVIGEAGATGNARGAHLHFAVYVDGKDVNPMVWLKPAPKPKPAPQRPQAPASRPKTIKPGTWDSDRVRELQRVMNAWWPHKRHALVVDGDYGDKTRRRVAWAQGRLGLPVTGIADTAFLDALSIH